MQVLKKDIRGRILTVARQQFKRKGQFHDFHARNSGVDRCWRWKHLQLLHEQRWIVPQVVCPVFRAWEAMLQEDHGIRNEDIMMMRLEEYLKAYIDEYVSLIDKYLVLMEILLFRAQGSSLEHSSIGAIRRSWFCYKLVIFVSLHKYRLFGRISAEFIPPPKNASDSIYPPRLTLTEARTTLILPEKQWLSLGWGKSAPIAVVPQTDRFKADLA